MNRIKDWYVKIVIGLGCSAIALLLFARPIALDLLSKYELYVPITLVGYMGLLLLAAVFTKE